MKLYLATHIADTVIEAWSRGERIDVIARASALLAQHPEAHATVEQVAATLEEELHHLSRRPSRAAS